MASIYEDLLEQLVIGNKVAISAEDNNLSSIQTSWYRYAKGNVLCSGRSLSIQTIGTEYILQLIPKPTERKQAQFRIVE